MNAARAARGGVHRWVVLDVPDGQHSAQHQFVQVYALAQTSAAPVQPSLAGGPVAGRVATFDPAAAMVRRAARWVGGVAGTAVVRGAACSSRPLIVFVVAPGGMHLSEQNASEFVIRACDQPCLLAP